MGLVLVTTKWLIRGCDVLGQVLVADVRSNYTHGVLVGSIRSLPSLVDAVMVNLATLHVLVVDGLSTIVLPRVILVILVESLSHSQLLHLVLDSLFVVDLELLPLLLLKILLPVFLFNLGLQSFLHRLLVSFSFLLHDLSIVSALTENVPEFLLLQVDSVVQDPGSGLDVREVLLGDTWVEPLVILGLLLVLSVHVVGVLSLVLRVLVVHVERLVIRVESLDRLPILIRLEVFELLSFVGLVVEVTLLRWLRVGEVAGFGLPPLFLLAEEVSLLDLPLQLVCEVLLVLQLILLVPIVGIRSGLVREVRVAHDGELVLVLVTVSVVDGHARVDDRLDSLLR